MLCASSIAWAEEIERVYPQGTEVSVTAKLCFSIAAAKEIADADAQVGMEEAQELFQYFEARSQCVRARGAMVKFTAPVYRSTGRHGSVIVSQGEMKFEMSNTTRPVYVLASMSVWLSLRCHNPPPGHICT